MSGIHRDAARRYFWEDDVLDRDYRFHVPVRIHYPENNVPGA
jgi:hypothetical protein